MNALIVVLGTQSTVKFGIGAALFLFPLAQIFAIPIAVLAWCHYLSLVLSSLSSLTKGVNIS